MGRSTYGSSDSSSAIPPIFPLQKTANDRFFQTASGDQWLVNECSSWALFQRLSEADARAYIDARVAQGFNTMKVAVVSFWQAPGGSPPDWQGNGPFTTPNDFSTAAGATAYWEHIDRMLNYGLVKGVQFYLVPCYLGYFQDATQGCANTINTSNNAAGMAVYGAFLANRYKNQPNIVWLDGGDQVPGTGTDFSVDQTMFLACINAIKAGSPTQWHSGHWAGGYANGVSANDPQPSGMLSTDWAPFSASIDVNILYSYNPEDPPYLRLEDALAIVPALVMWPGDQSYISGFTDAQPQGSDAEVLEKAHRAMCTSAAGSSFCAGSNWYLFTDFLTDSTSQQQQVFWWQFWSAQPFSEMFADLTSTYIFAGRGTHGTNSYVSGIASSTRLIAYVPNGAAPEVDMTLFPSDREGEIFIPTSGVTISLGTLSNAAPLTFTNATGAAYLLVLR